MSSHQSGRRKLNVSAPHKRSMMRNQIISLIINGHLVTTKARAKEASRLAEKLVTIARTGNNFNTRRRVQALLPYKDEAIMKLFTDIAPKYTERNGGYTRVISLGIRPSDTAPIARVEWV